MTHVERTTPVAKLNLKLNVKIKFTCCRTITVSALAAEGGNNNKQVLLKKCAPFTDCISETNNTQADNA